MGTLYFLFLFLIFNRYILLLRHKESNLYLLTHTHHKGNLMKELTINQIIGELDKTIIGQDEAKIVIANAFRDRFRRTLLSAELKKWITVKNILLKGESGTGKTELARQVAAMCGCPFVTIDATTLTAAGYIGADISDSLRRLLKQAETMYPRIVKQYRADEAKRLAAEDKALPSARKSFLEDLRSTIKCIADSLSSTISKKQLRELGKLLSAGYKKGKIEISNHELYITSGSRNKAIKYNFNLSLEVDPKGYPNPKLLDVLAWLLLVYTKDGFWCTIHDSTAKSMGVAEKHINSLYEEIIEKDSKVSKILSTLFSSHDIKGTEATDDEDKSLSDKFSELGFGNISTIFSTKKLKQSKLVDVNYDIHKFLDLILDGASKKSKASNLPPELKDHKTYVENYGIVFIDEIDKLVPDGQSKGVGSIDVQFELLKVLEGGDFDLDGNNSYRDERMGTLRTDNILFICAGAFVNVSEEGLISEIRGRLPISVTLHPLNNTDIVKIMKESRKSPIREIVEKAKTQGVDVSFTDEAIERLATLSAEYNKNEVNLGARRITSFIERVYTYVTIKDPNADKYVIDNKTVEEALTKYFDENLHQFKIKELTGPLGNVIDFFKSKHTSPLIPYRNKELLYGRTYFITNHEYRLLAAVARALQWYTQDYERLTREACEVLFKGSKRHGGLLKFIDTNIDSLLPNIDDFHLMDKEELLNASTIVSSYGGNDSDHSKRIKENLEKVLKVVNK